MSVTCEACKGTGQRALTQIEIDTLRAIGAGWVTTAEILPRLASIQGYKTSQTALCNRLLAMLGSGLAERRPDNGKQYSWRTRSKL